MNKLLLNNAKLCELSKNKISSEWIKYLTEDIKWIFENTSCFEVQYTFFDYYVSDYFNSSSFQLSISEESVNYYLDILLTEGLPLLQEAFGVNFEAYINDLITIGSTQYAEICMGIRGKFYGKIYFKNLSDQLFSINYSASTEKARLVPLANSFTQLVLFPEERLFEKDVERYEDWRTHLLQKRAADLTGWYIQQIEEKILYKIPKGYSMILRHFTGELQYGEGQYHKNRPIVVPIQNKEVKIKRFYAIEDYMSDDDTHLHEAIDIFREKDMMPIAICDNGEMICLGFGLENSNIISLWTADYSIQIEEWYTFLGFIDEITR